MHIRSHLLYILGLSLVFWGVYIICFDSRVDMNGDNVSYYALSGALAQGKGYVNTIDPAELPFSYFPPGYPLLLVPFRCFTDSVVFLKVLNGICLWVSLLLWWMILATFGSAAADPKVARPLAFVTLLFVALHPNLLYYAMIMMSEMPYLLLATVALWLLTQLDKAELHQPWRVPKAYLLVWVLVWAFHVRTQGVILLAGLLGYALMGRYWRFSGFVFGGFLLGILPWMLRNRWHGLPTSDYLSKMWVVNTWRPEEGMLNFGELFRRFFETQHMLLTKALPESILPFLSVNYKVPPSFWSYVGVGCLLFVLGYGLWYFLPKYRYFVWAYFLAMMGIIGLWAAPSQARYVTTLIPMLQAAWMYGLFLLLWHGLGRWPSIHRLIPYGLLVLLPLFIISAHKRYKQAHNTYKPAFMHYLAVANWAKEHLPSHTIVACRKPALFHIHSGTYAVRYAYDKPKSLISNLLQQKVDYVLLDALGYSSTRLYLYPTIEAYPQLFTVVLRSATPTYFLRFNREQAQAMVREEP